MGLIGVLTQFGFDPECRSKMARHKDTRPGVNWDELVESVHFEQYQSWQAEPVFHDIDYLLSFIGDVPKQARLWSVYRVIGNELVEYEKLPQEVPWPWREETPHYHYQLERVPDFEPLEGQLVIEWSSERNWAQSLKDSQVLECPTLHDIDVPSWSPLFSEGKAFAHLITSRRRSSEARNNCLDVQGCRCAACGMTFPERYGGLGEGFMHVHHLAEVSRRSGEYVIDPKHDLRPVCPNCHAMLHWNTDKPRTIEELRDLLAK